MNIKKNKIKITHTKKKKKKKKNGEILHLGKRN